MRAAGDWRVAPPVPGDVRGALVELGVQVEREEHGELWARCPQHAARTGREDRHPSFSVNESSGLFSCFSCGYAGAFPRLVADLLDIAPVHAEAWTARYGQLTRAARQLAALALTPQRPAAGEPSLAGYIEPPAHALAKRAIDRDAATRFGILWDERTSAFILPIRDPGGRLLGYQYKRGSYVRNRPRLIRKSETLFGADVFEGERAVLVESPLDCARLWSAGIPGALASFGAVVSDEQINLLVRLAGSVVIALDNPAIDPAGALGAASVEKRLRGRIHPVLHFDYRSTENKDPGEMSDAEIYAGIDGARSSLAMKLAAMKTRR